MNRLPDPVASPKFKIHVSKVNQIKGFLKTRTVGDNQNDISSDVASRQHTLSYVMSDRDLKNKLIQCQNSKDIIDFLDKTERTLEFIKANSCSSPQNKNNSRDNIIKDLKANFNKISNKYNSRRNKHQEVVTQETSPSPQSLSPNILPVISSPNQESNRRMNSPDVIIKRNRRMKPLKTNKTIIYGNEEPPRKNQSPSHKIKYAGKAKIDNIKELISLMFNDNKSALSKLQKTINLHIKNQKVKNIPKEKQSSIKAKIRK